MTSEEILRTHDELARALSESGLDWVVRQVDETLRSGCPVEKPIRIFKEEDRGVETPTFFGERSGTRRSGKSTLMMTLEPWPQSEQLLLLITAIREALIHAEAIEREQLRLLADLGVNEVLFVSDSEVESRSPLRLAGTQDQRMEALAELLRQLENEVRS